MKGIGSKLRGIISIKGMKVYLEKEKKFKEVKGNTVNDILKELRINPTTVIVSKNGNLVLDDTKVSAKDEIKIFTVVSGG